MPTPASIQRTYLLLLLGNTLAASFIWGINTIFLLDAGLSNLEAFAANAFFTAGMIVSEVPTGIVADTISVAGGYIAQATSLGVPFVLRAIVLAVMFTFAFALMKDVGFTPNRGDGFVRGVRRISSAIEYGWRVPSVKWMMLAAPTRCSALPAASRRSPCSAARRTCGATPARISSAR